MSIFALSTKGSRRYDHVKYHPSDSLLFGPETRGLPDQVLSEVGLDQALRIPMQTGSRSLNLSNAVAIVVYEGLRQLDFNLQA